MKFYWNTAILVYWYIGCLHASTADWSSYNRPLIAVKLKILTVWLFTKSLPTSNLSNNISVFQRGWKPNSLSKGQRTNFIQLLKKCSKGLLSLGSLKWGGEWPASNFLYQHGLRSNHWKTSSHSSSGSKTKLSMDFFGGCQCRWHHLKIWFLHINLISYNLAIIL